MANTGFLNVACNFASNGSGTPATSTSDAQPTSNSYGTPLAISGNDWGATASTVQGDASVTILQCKGYLTSKLSNASLKTLAVGNTVKWTAGWIGQKYNNP